MRVPYGFVFSDSSDSNDSIGSRPAFFPLGLADGGESSFIFPLPFELLGGVFSVGVFGVLGVLSRVTLSMEVNDATGRSLEPCEPAEGLGLATRTGGSL